MALTKIDNEVGMSQAAKLLLDPSSSFLDFANNQREKLEQTLDELVALQTDTLYCSLFEAARYSLLAPGKRLRPLLTLACVKSLGGSIEQALKPACILELVHTYSLIHDDLPCMDNDDLRRGRPTLHKVFPESHSLLTGNFLLTLSFEILSSLKELSPYIRLKLIERLAFHSGAHGLLGGQVIDLNSEGKKVSLNTLEKMDLGKTSSLFTCCLEFAAIITQNESLIESFEKLGKLLGLIFQIKDDLLEVESSKEELGKSPDSDIKNNKATYLSILGIDEANRVLEAHVAECKTLLETIPSPALMQSFLYLISERKT